MGRDEAQLTNDESMTKPAAQSSMAAVRRLSCTSLQGRSAPSSFVVRHFRPAIALLLLSPAKLFACAVCYGQSDSPLAEGMNMGILFLLAVVALVLGGFVAFFIYLARRSAAVAAARPSPPNSISSS